MKIIKVYNSREKLVFSGSLTDFKNDSDIIVITEA